MDGQRGPSVLPEVLRNVVRDDPCRSDRHLALHFRYVFAVARFSQGRIYTEGVRAVIGYVILLWDTLLILPDEIERVWHGGISLAKLAYVLNHYVSIGVRPA